MRSSSRILWISPLSTLRLFPALEINYIERKKTVGFECNCNKLFSAVKKKNNKKISMNLPHSVSANNPILLGFTPDTMDTWHQCHFLDFCFVRGKTITLYWPSATSHSFYRHPITTRFVNDSCCSFNNRVSSSEYIGPNDEMIMNNVSERMLKENRHMSILMYYLGLNTAKNETTRHHSGTEP
jgi:hypothetical protein